MDLSRSGRVVTAIVVLAVASFVAVGTASPAHADSVRDDAWYLEDLRITEAHRITKGKGVVVAVVDSGVDPTHPDIVGNVLPGVDIFTGEPPARGRDGYTAYHGTAMAGLIAGHGHGPGRRSGVLGIAPEAKILPVKVTRPEGLSTGREVASGIEWALSLGADVISVSLQTPTETLIDRAVKKAWNMGVPVLGATGNDGPSGMQFVRGVIPVTAIGSDGGFVEGLQPMWKPIGVAAPGGDIPTAREGGYWTNTGTSNSAAIAAGVMALIKARYPDDEIAHTYRRIRVTADDRGVGGDDSEYGYGVVNPVAALTEPVPYVSIGASTEPPEPTPSAAARDTSKVPTVVIVGGVGWLAVLLLGAAVGGVVLRARRR
ncbi:S8 family serine peptidase [Cryptosporangium aurantiacum]|uniref:Subtilase family protein n=1 Tax=Cryptosporangium aurantiacum TaxID=134849 RepID=A0A1M7NIC0_9ACTN|nr:S8 family serine peptidase [Cryptosporangium aurantiacum]SHN03445.1 Subtilase family protein [Cryptosporangium aurantiacum]